MNNIQDSTSSQGLNLTGAFSRLSKLFSNKTNRNAVAQVTSNAIGAEKSDLSQEGAEIKFDSKGKPVIEPSEDSVKKDIEKLKKVISKVGVGVSKKVTPKIEQGSEIKYAASNAFKRANGADFIVKILKGFIIGVVLLTLIYLGVTLFRSVGNGASNKKDISQVTGPTPTNIEFQPYKPSVYAEDAEILGFEESLNILEKEIASTNIRETSLNPPKLDFNINFQGK